MALAFHLERTIGIVVNNWAIYWIPTSSRDDAHSLDTQREDDEFPVGMGRSKLPDVIQGTLDIAHLKTLRIRADACLGSSRRSSKSRQTVQVLNRGPLLTALRDSSAQDGSSEWRHRREKKFAQRQFYHSLVPERSSNSNRVLRTGHVARRPSRC